MSCFILYFIWKAVYASSDSTSLSGFTITQMVMYVFIAFSTRLLSSTDGAWIMSEQIKDGSICMTLIKPIKYHISILFDQIGGLLSIFHVPFIFLIGIEVYNFNQTGSITPISNILFFVISVALAFLVNFLFGLMIGYLAFFLKNLWGMNMLIEGVVGFLSGSMIPFVLFPNGLRIFFQALPFASMNYIPVMIYLGEFTGIQILFNILLQVFWLVAFYLLSKFLWSIAIKHLSVQGG